LADVQRFVRHTTATFSRYMFLMAWSFWRFIDSAHRLEPVRTTASSSFLPTRFGILLTDLGVKAAIGAGLKRRESHRLVLASSTLQLRWWISFWLRRRAGYGLGSGEIRHVDPQGLHLPLLFGILGTPWQCPVRPEKEVGEGQLL